MFRTDFLWSKMNRWWPLSHSCLKSVSLFTESNALEILINKYPVMFYFFRFSLFVKFCRCIMLFEVYLFYLNLFSKFLHVALGIYFGLFYLI